MNKLTLSFAKLVLERLADGQWQNFLTHEAFAGNVSVRDWFWQVACLGILLGHGFTEQDDTWRGSRRRARRPRQSICATAAIRIVNEPPCFH